MNAWIEINTTALEHNLRAIRNWLPQGVRICAVVKANAYGHDDVLASRAFVRAGADMLAVTRLDEGLRLRAAGIDAPVMLLAPCVADEWAEAVRAGIRCTVTCMADLDALAAGQTGGPVAQPVHLKVDTGMGRFGCMQEEAGALLAHARTLGLTVEGVYTHFANAGQTHSAQPAERQMQVFRPLLASLEADGLRPPIAHACNSAGALTLPDAHLQMVRVGNLLYGQYPSSRSPRPLDLQLTWRFQARICQIRTLPAGSRPGYGSEQTLTRTSRIAAVPVGLADGVLMAPEAPIWRMSPWEWIVRRARRQRDGALHGLIHGRKARVVGRVSMQVSLFDVTDLPDVQIGDTMTLPVKRLNASALIPRVPVEAFA